MDDTPSQSFSPLREEREIAHFIETNWIIWIPPEPRYFEDEWETSEVADIDDDDGLHQWGKDSLLSDESSSRFRFAEQQYKALEEVMNGKFKSLVSSFLAFEGILPSGDAGEEWLDIVTSLSWRAALGVNPDATGRFEGLVKVKCIATGSRSQSHLIKGLVFKKNATHKHMGREHKNPRLLLLSGMLEESTIGPLSFSDMKQERDSAKPIIEMVESTHPNVVLVEKFISRYVQEYLLAKGVTVVVDMKLDRLERIARFTGTQIISADSSLMNHKLIRCDFFHFEKLMEEHSTPMKDGRKTSKTLMFLEGCSRSLHRTVLLKGAPTDELKKVKAVVHSSVIAAYHLIAESAFLGDQRDTFRIGGSSVVDGVPEDDAGDQKNAVVAPVWTSPQVGGLNNSSDMEEKDIVGELNNSDRAESSSAYCKVPMEEFKCNIANEDKIQDEDNIHTNLDAESISYLKSSLCMKGTCCELNNLSHISYYKSSDVSLEWFLRGSLLNNMHRCSTCGEPPMSHDYSYVHQSGKLTVQVKHLPEMCLPGEAEGKLWMWTRCLKCEGSSKRVVMSTAACGLSFGKFLKLTLSSHSTSHRLSSCGSSLHKDYISFYGLGPMVAMFRYSAVNIYTLCIPPQVLEFNNPSRQDWIKKEAENVLGKGLLLFTEVSNSLQKIRSGICSSLSNSSPDLFALLKVSMEVEEMVKQERSDFEAHIQKVITKNELLGQAVHETLSLNGLNQELVLESYVWNQRLHFLLSYAWNQPLQEKSSGDTDSATNLIRRGSTMGEISSTSGSKSLDPGMSISDNSKVLNLDDSENWVWTPFPEILKAYRKDLQRGYSQKFDFSNSFTSECLFSVNQLINKDRTRLHIPFDPDENVVTLYEGELTSIVACALAMLNDRYSSAEDLAEGGRKEAGHYEKAFENANCVASDGSAVSSLSPTTSNVSSFDFSILVDLVPSFEALHPEISLVSGKLPGEAKFSVVCLFAEHFHALRRHCCPSELDYIDSLSRCTNSDAEVWESGSLVVKTLDDRFIVKQITKAEVDSFSKFASDYFVYVTKSHSSMSPTCLAKILGIYQITIKHSKRGKDTKYDLMVMENLFFGRNITRLYDLKGSWNSRYTLEDGPGTIFLDANFVEDMPLSPLYVSMKAKRLLERAVWNDTSFLTSINVMDYSMLVGVDMQRQELVYGIIHYLRQYTWDKHLVTSFKGFLLPKNVSPTIISPKLYQKRFRKAMSWYFVGVHSSPLNDAMQCREKTYNISS